MDAGIDIDSTHAVTSATIPLIVLVIIFYRPSVDFVQERSVKQAGEAAHGTSGAAAGIAGTTDIMGA
jgi:hypothetical protein